MGLAQCAYQQFSLIAYLTCSLIPVYADIPFDIVVSNPPYVTSHEYGQLDLELHHEPSLALFGGRDGLDAYRHISTAAMLLLKVGGHIVLEVGAKQSVDVRTIFEQEATYPVMLDADGFEVRSRSAAASQPQYHWKYVQTVCDLAGHERCVVFQLLEDAKK